ncbi:FAD-binding oxidoreductase [Kineosporia rhizophila]|uniref:FAD-binding oxidoreductase n=1 Tax=Kineosporia rhizophila TaxID=84633 RepID=UPI001E492766|nr:FAD-binding oxidoreductase [Kineosporia rhizophila]MCE0537943.1 FAD-binding oxidoreductase [Kineosporia rhizophila]
MTSPLADLPALVAEVEGPVSLPGSDDYENDCRTYNLMSPLQPLIAVGATGPRDVAAAVRFAAIHDLPVAVRGGGHCVARPADEALLIDLGRMSHVHIDPARRTARIEGAATWDDVIRAAAGHGLAPVSGSSPTVGAIGYLLGGGQSPVLGRSHGYASDHVTHLEVVLADGTFRMVTRDRHPDLFFALRGGKGNFGVVCAVETNLVPLSSFYGGGLYFPGEALREVLGAWSRWVTDLPQEMSSSIAIQRLPADPALPPVLQGKFVTHVRFSSLGETEAAEKILAPLRAAAPIVLDTLQEMPYMLAGTIHADPPQAIPYFDRSTGLSRITAETVDALVAVLGPDSQSPLVHAEIRALGGKLDQAPAAADAVSTRGLPFQLFAFGVGGPEQASMLQAALDDLIVAVGPWRHDRSLPNFLSPDEAQTGQQVREVYGHELYHELAAVKARHDPANRFRVNHNVRPATDTLQR